MPNMMGLNVSWTCNLLFPNVASMSSKAHAPIADCRLVRSTWTTWNASRATQRDGRAEEVRGENRSCAFPWSKIISRFPKMRVPPNHQGHWAIFAYFTSIEMNGDWMVTEWWLNGDWMVTWGSPISGSPSWVRWCCRCSAVNRSLNLAEGREVRQQVQHLEKSGRASYGSVPSEVWDVFWCEIVVDDDEEDE